MLGQRIGVPTPRWAATVSIRTVIDEPDLRPQWSTGHLSRPTRPADEGLLEAD